MYFKVVAPFYAFWSSYCTPRSFVWCEEHDIRDATDRYVRRIMEKENKKLRDKFKKDRNEEIRVLNLVCCSLFWAQLNFFFNFVKNLVSFMRKKDKRCEQYKVSN